MTSTLRSLSKFFCAGLICVTLAGCAVTSTENQATSGNATTDSSADSKTAEFINSKEQLNATLKANFIDFSFKFPDDWEAQEVGARPDAKNFVKVAKSLDKKDNGEFSLENFAVGYLKTNGDAKKDAADFPKVTSLFDAEYKKGFADYKKISEGPTKIGSLNGYELRFQSTVKGSKQGDITQWGRVVMLPKPGTKQGVTLVMMATSLSPDVKSAADLGVKGQLPVILKSFTFEKKQPEKKE